MAAADANAGLLVGVGTAMQDRAPGEGVDAVHLMIDAAKAAGADSGVNGLLARVGRVYVSQGTWRAPDAGRSIARAIGAPNARSVFVQLGIPQQALIDQALTAINRGDVEAALVVGGEAKARDDRARRAGITLPSAGDTGTTPDEVQTPLSEIVAAAELAIGFVVPVQQYAAIDNAVRAAEGRSIPAHTAEIDTLWSRFDGVALTNPAAAFAAGRSAEQLRDPEPDNRMLAFPYNKWHATHWSVDQAGALLLCSRRLADELGIESERRVYPLVSLESSHSVSLSKRAALHRWPAMNVLGHAAEAHLGVRLADIELVELYSCFPAAVRIQQRELGLALDRTPTMTGGMPFAGGPFNNVVFQATAAMVQRLRTDPGQLGLVTTVSGLLTKPGLAIWSCDPGERAPLLADLAEAAASATELRNVIEGYVGPAIVATYTVRTGQSGLEAVVIGDTPDGDRVVAIISDPDAARAALTDELIGRAIQVDGTAATVA